MYERMMLDQPLSSTPALDLIDCPADLRARPVGDLQKVASELRQECIETVAVTGGHLGSSLGVIELTVALHYVFETPHDRLIWDVGHQAYPHKILTGRRHQMRSLRQGGGLSGFTKRAESAYDPFGAAHSSTSISSALGFAVARDMLGEQRNVVAVIGDGAMSAGMAYEALNNAGALGSRLIVVLNDNRMSIAQPTGAMANYFNRLALRDEGANEWVSPTWFEELGFNYIGPVDGHDVDRLVDALQQARDMAAPVVVHAITHKGKGYAPAETAADRMHGVSAYDPATGAQVKGKAGAPSYTKVFAESLI